MLKYLSYTSNPFVLGALGGILMLCALFYDDRSNGNTIVLRDYLKLFVTTFVIVVAMVYLSRFNLGTMLGGGVASVAQVAQKSLAGEEVYSGMPDF